MVPPRPRCSGGVLDNRGQAGLKTSRSGTRDTLFPKTTAQGAMDSRKQRLQVVRAEAYRRGNDFAPLLTGSGKPNGCTAAATYFDDAVAMPDK